MTGPMRATRWRYARSVGHFAILGSLGSTLVIMVEGALASKAAFEPGDVVAIIPIWLAYSLVFSFPTGLLAILGAGWLAAFSGPRVKNLFVYLGLCTVSAGLLSLAGSELDLSERLMGSGFVPEPATSLMALSWMLAGAGCGYLLRRIDMGFRPKTGDRSKPA
jgi:hypothetical protein